eukprot:4133312-Lingulodinium_polyedra.AAC.1
MRLGNLDMLANAYGQSREYKAKLGGLRGKSVKPVAMAGFDSLVLAPMTTLNTLWGQAVGAMQP